MTWKNVEDNIAYTRQWRLDNPDKCAYHRYVQSLRRYGLSPKDYEALRVAQDYSCAICGCPEWESRNGRLHVDHCHESDKIRGLLCCACNIGLGSYGDDPERLRKAATYIENYRAKPQ